MNVYISIKISLKFPPEVTNIHVGIGSGNGLAPNRCQAIIWNDLDQYVWHHMR